MKLFDNTKALASLVPAVRTDDADGDAVDTQGYRDGMLVISVGDLDTGDGNETYAFHIEESDDGSTGWTDVSGATATVTADNEVAVVRVAELNVARKRYLRAVLDVGGTSPSCPCSAVFQLGEAYAGAVNSD